MVRTATTGVVYTPAAVTVPMVARALDELVGELRADAVAELRVCDPAVGEGAFLIAAAARLAEHLGARGVTKRAAREQAARCVYGVDRDARAVRVARAATGAPAGQLICADALTLAWPAAFPAVFAADRGGRGGPGGPGGFDIVVGNPPYIRQELLGSEKAALRRYAVYDGVADLYVYFVELAHRLLRPGGRWCLVVPNKWLTAAYGRPLRAYLARAGSVDGLVDFAAAPPLFPGADAFPLIAWGRPASAATAATAPTTTTPIAAARSQASVAAALAAPLVPHARARWQADPWHIDAAEDGAQLAALEARWPPLADLLSGPPARGVVTGCNRAFVVDAATRAQLLAADPAAAAWLRPFVRGRDVRRWSAAPTTRYLLAIAHGTPFAELPRPIRAHLAAQRTALEPRPPEHTGAWAGRKPGRYAWHELQDPIGPLVTARAPRLLYQDIQSAPACSLDAHGELAPDTTVWILPTADPLLLAILNSSLYAWYARRRFPPALNGAVRPKREYLLRLPIAQPPRALRRQIADLVAAQLAAPTAARDAELDAAVRAAYQVAGQVTASVSPVARTSPPARR